MKHSYHADLLERFPLPDNLYHEVLACGSTQATLRSWGRCRNLSETGQFNKNNGHYDIQDLVAQAPLVTQRLKDAVDIADDVVLQGAQVRLVVKTMKDTKEGNHTMYVEYTLMIITV